jgi:CBS domain-containing protein
MIEQRILTPTLVHVRVRDCMHPGVFTCAPDDPLAVVATVMANQKVHSVVITNGSGERPIGLVSDLDVVTAVATGADCTAAAAAATEPVTVSSHESLLGAAQLMSEHGVSHLVVLDRASGYPVGVLSTLDVAAVYAGAAGQAA